MHHAPSGIDFTCAWIDEFSSGLMDSVPVFPELFPFQPARVFRWWPYQFRAPLAGADVVRDVVLGDIRVRRTRGHRGVRINLRKANAAGLRLSPLRHEEAD